MTNRTWLGGGNNEASNPNDWSPTGALRLGDTLNISSGIMNVSGNALKGDTLDVAAIGSLATVDINVAGTVTLHAMQSSANQLNFSGGTLKFIGTSGFTGDGGSVGHVTFHDNLVGSGTLHIEGGNHDGAIMEVDGSVAKGLTFDLSAGSAPTDALQIDDPAKFHGLLDFPTAFTIGTVSESAFNFVAFMGLHATSADISSDMLQMFDGKKLVDSVRIAGGANLQLQQNSSGVILSSGFEGIGGVPGGSGGMPIPLQHIS